MKLKNKLINKRMLYTVCFMMLTILELIRGSSFTEMELPTGVIRLSDVLGGLKAGDLWYIGANLTGVVMMLIIFSAYQLKIFVTVGNIIWTVLCLGTMIGLPYYHIHQGATFHLWQVETAVLNVWWLFIIIKHMIVKAIHDKKIAIKWNLPAIVWGLMTLCMMFSVYQNKLWVIWYFLMFGVFFLTEYTAKEREDIWNGMLNGLLVSFVIVQVAAFFLRPFDYVRYLGLFANSNNAGLYYLIIYVICLCKLHSLHIKKAKPKVKFCVWLLAGCSLSLQFMTMCRTAWIVSVVVTVLFGIIVMRKIWRNTWKKVIQSGALIVLSMIITFAPLFMAARWVPTMIPIRVWYTGEWGKDDRVVMGESAFSEKYTDIDEFLENVFNRIILTFQSAKVNNPFVLKAYATQISEEYERVELVETKWVQDMAFRARLTIYKAYWEDLNWNGNENNKGHYWIGTTGAQSWHAQNVWLQIAYYYGIPAGLFLICLTVLLFVHSYKKMMNHTKNPYSIIAFFICLMYFGFGMTESVWTLGQLSMFLIFFVNMPLGDEQTNLEKE